MALPSFILIQKEYALRTSHFAVCISIAFLFAMCFAESNAQSLTVTLTSPAFHGYNVACFGEKTGAINLAVIGGTPPYTYLWTDGKTTGNISGLAAGYYKVSVHDANNQMGDASITLSEPEALSVTAVIFKYPTGDNISCHNCFNGSIDISVEKGVAPYTYDWGDGVTTQDRTALGEGTYQIIIVDQNGCDAKSEEIYLIQPERNDWTMTGNAGTNPAVQYIGTSDNKDVVFKSNGQEALRFKSNGE